MSASTMNIISFWEEAQASSDSGYFHEAIIKFERCRVLLTKEASEQEKISKIVVQLLEKVNKELEDHYSLLGGNFYIALGVRKDCTKKHIRKSYKSFCVKYHPDKNLDINSTELFQIGQTAHEILLSDFDLKKYFPTVMVADWLKRRSNDGVMKRTSPKHNTKNKDTISVGTPVSSGTQNKNVKIEKNTSLKENTSDTSLPYVTPSHHATKDNTSDNSTTNKSFSQKQDKKTKSLDRNNSSHFPIVLKTSDSNGINIKHQTQSSKTPSPNHRDGDRRSDQIKKEEKDQINLTTPTKDIDMKTTEELNVECCMAPSWGRAIVDDDEDEVSTGEDKTLSRAEEDEQSINIQSDQRSTPTESTFLKQSSITVNIDDDESVASMGYLHELLDDDDDDDDDGEEEEWDFAFDLNSLRWGANIVADDEGASSPVAETSVRSSSPLASSGGHQPFPSLLPRLASKEMRNELESERSLETSPFTSHGTSHLAEDQTCNETCHERQSELTRNQRHEASKSESLPSLFPLKGIN